MDVAPCIVDRVLLVAATCEKRVHVIRTCTVIRHIHILHILHILYTANQQILACYYIWQIWRIACFH